MKDQPKPPTPSYCFVCWRCNQTFANPPHRTVPHEHGDPTVERWCGNCWADHEKQRKEEKAKREELESTICFGCKKPIMAAVAITPGTKENPFARPWCSECWEKKSEEDAEKRKSSVEKFTCCGCQNTFRGIAWAVQDKKEWCSQCWRNKQAEDAKNAEVPNRDIGLVIPTRMQWLLFRRLDVLEEITRVAPKAGIGEGSKRIGNLACEVLWLEHLIEQVKAIEATEKGTK